MTTATIIDMKTRTVRGIIIDEPVKSPKEPNMLLSPDKNISILLIPPPRETRRVIIIDAVILEARPSKKGTREITELITKNMTRKRTRASIPDCTLKVELVPRIWLIIF